MRRPEINNSKAAVLLEISKKDRVRFLSSISPVVVERPRSLLSSPWVSLGKLLLRLGVLENGLMIVDLPEQKVVTADIWTKMVL